jgi:IS5 family transposase
MNQAALNLNLSVKQTRKQVSLAQMEQVVPWAALVELIAPYYPEGRTGRSPFSLLTMLRIHFRGRAGKSNNPNQPSAMKRSCLTSKRKPRKAEKSTCQRCTTRSARSA